MITTCPTVSSLNRCCSPVMNQGMRPFFPMTLPFAQAAIQEILIVLPFPATDRQFQGKKKRPHTRIASIIRLGRFESASNAVVRSNLFGYITTAKTAGTHFNGAGSTANFGFNFNNVWLPGAANMVLWFWNFISAQRAFTTDFTSSRHIENLPTSNVLNC